MYDTRTFNEWFAIGKADGNYRVSDMPRSHIVLTSFDSGFDTWKGGRIGFMGFIYLSRRSRESGAINHKRNSGSHVRDHQYVVLQTVAPKRKARSTDGARKGSR